MPKIIPNQTFPNEIWKALDEAYKLREREGVHVSDLVFPKKAYWRTINPDLKLTEKEEQEYRMREHGYWIAGEAHHEMIQRAFDYISTAVIEKEIKYEGVIAHVDLSIQEGDRIIENEIKSTRAKHLYTVETIPSHWIDQLSMYVAISTQNTNTDGIGRLTIFYLNLNETELDPNAPPNQTVPWLSSFDFHWSAKELENIRFDIKRRKNQLLIAIDRKDPGILKDCPRWLCPKCRYQKICQPARNIERVEADIDD